MSLKNSGRLPFRVVGSCDGAPDKIIVDRDGKEVGDLYLDTWEEAQEVVDAINSGLHLVSSGRTEAQGG
jgi:hypothetical protein